ncbi:MAG: hypothetical protein V7679_13225 [Parasphingorhabdus sp.]
MTNSIKMTKNINAPLNDGLPAKAAGSLSMISMLAISVGMAAAPAQAQEMTAPPMAAPVQAPPVISPQPAPTASPTMAPTIAAPPASSPPAVRAETMPPVSQERADDLARKGGFDAETVAPEALAQIEREQQERKAAAAKAAADSAKTPVRASGGTVADNGADRATAAREAAAVSEMPTLAGVETVGATGAVAAIPTAQPAPEVAASPDAFSGETGADWGLLAALAALLGVGGAGAYAASRRRKSKGEAITEPRRNDPLPASLNAATISDQRHDLVEEEIDPAADMEQVTARTLESKATTKADFAQFVADLPAFDEPVGKAGRGLALGQRRVAAAPRPYLAEADLARTAGYFTANVDAMPTPQNPFLTRQKRLKRARYLDGKLAGMNTPPRESRTRIAGEMKVSRPLEPAFS